MKRKIFLTVATIIFCGIAIEIGMNNNFVMHYAWHIWYGDHIRWHGIDVTINDDEYFMPASKDGKTLYIANLKLEGAYVVLNANVHTAELEKKFVENFCQSQNCIQLNEQTYMVGKRKVSSFSFAKLNTNSNIETFQQHVVIDGGGAWVEYFGSEPSYQKFKPTIDSIVEQIAH